jgi:outer membrane immunogenic protein
MQYSKSIVSTIVAFTAFAGIGAASAADLAPGPYTKAPAMVVNPGYNWTGFYIGVHAGATWLTSTNNITPANGGLASWFVPPTQIATSLPLNSTGFIGGGQLGYNWQVNPIWVVGLETDFSGTSLSHTVSLPGPDDTSRIVTASDKLDWFGTVRGRIGMTPTDRALLYVTGGLAYGHASLSTAVTRPDPTSAPPNGCGGQNNCQSGSVSDTKIGWTVGGGLEWAFANNWSLKGEYLYYDLGTLSHLMKDPFFPATFNASADIKGSIARVGLNYKFDWGGPVVAKY